MEPNNISPELIEQMLADRDVRLEIVSKSHIWFFYFYFAHFVSYTMAAFHEEWFRLTEDTSVRSAVIVAFRGSAKTSIFTLSFPIWAILGVLQIKHVLILCSTQQKAQMRLQNIKRELETNRVLQADLGPFKEVRNEWNTVSLHIPKYEAKITIASVEQSVRGMSFGQHRLQLIVVDDLEDIDSVRTKESRDKIDDWLMSELIPAGDLSTRMFIVGNLLHNDSVIKRLHDRIENGIMSGIYMQTPLLDSVGIPTWPGKYPDVATVELERSKGLTEVVWKREMQLEIIPEEDQVVREEWIQFYDMLPDFKAYANYRFALTSVDPAIVEKDTADYTAIMSVQVYGLGKERKIYILPHPVNERLSAPAARDRIASISRTLGDGVPTKVIVEGGAYQISIPQMLGEMDIPAESVSISGHDKRSRLMTTAPYIQSGGILFPRKGCEDLITQMLGFGAEKHDDMVDALTLIVLYLLKEDSIGGFAVAMDPEMSKLPSKNQEQLEQEADTATRLEQEYERSNFNRMMWAAMHRNRRY